MTRSVIDTIPWAVLLVESNIYGWVSTSQISMWSESRSVVFDFLQPHGLYNPWNSPGQKTGVGNCSLLQGIFPTLGLNPGLLRCRQILYQLSHREAQEYWSGEPIPSSADLPNPGIKPGSPIELWEYPLGGQNSMTSTYLQTTGSTTSHLDSLRTGPVLTVLVFPLGQRVPGPAWS